MRLTTCCLDLSCESQYQFISFFDMYLQLFGPWLVCARPSSAYLHPVLTMAGDLTCIHLGRCLFFGVRFNDKIAFPTPVWCFAPYTLCIPRPPPSVELAPSTRRVLPTCLVIRVSDSCRRWRRASTSWMSTFGACSIAARTQAPPFEECVWSIDVWPRRFLETAVIWTQPVSASPSSIWSRMWRPFPGVPVAVFFSFSSFDLLLMHRYIFK